MQSTSTSTPKKRADAGGEKVDGVLQENRGRLSLACISHRVSSRGRRGAVASGVFDPEARPGSPSAVRRWGSCAEVKARGGVDARASSTTSNAEIGHDPHRPEGLRRHGPVFFVATPRRWRDIAVVAAPRIRTHGPRNGRRRGSRSGLAGRGARTRGTSSTPRRENTAGCDASPAAAGGW